METVLSGRSATRRADQVTLVLGGGWKLGCAFHAGVILALKDAWGLDARHLDSVIGTSSGAVVGGLLGAGMSPDDLFCREAENALGSAGQALMARLGNGNQGDHGGRDDHGRGGVSDSQRPHRTLGLSARGAFAALLPRGWQSMAPLERYFDDLIGADWPTHVDLKFCAVDLGNGQRVALDSSSGATVGQAIAASCSIPGVSRPVVIQGREYIDGAMYSINNADLAAGIGRSGEHTDAGRHVVIVSAPLSADRLRMRLGPLGLLRNAMHLQTAAEVRKLRHVDQLHILQPTAANIAAMGSDLNANRRRAQVAESAYARAMDVFRAAEAPAMSPAGASSH